MYAKIIVDISHHEVNQLFDYIIPSAMEGFLEKGSRVYVPFGAQKRLGFVMEITEHSDEATKEILSCLDIVPTLDDEHFLMIEHLKLQGPNLYHELLKTVINPELLVTYTKEVYAKDLSLVDEDLRHFFNRKNIWKLKNKDQIYQHKLTRLKRQNIVEINTIMKQKSDVKKETYYTYNTYHTYPRIQQYEHIKDLFHNHIEYSKKALLEQGISISTLNTLAKHNVLIPFEKEVLREPKHIFDELHKEIIFTDEQQHAVNQIHASLNERKTFLLKGITGSGKTEVYIEIIKKVIEHNQQVLLLVPEITLIAPMLQRLKPYVSNLYTYHSGLSKGERFDQYREIQKNKSSVVVGTRSAIFLNLEHLGLIIIDEEHDESYQQAEGVIYHARDIARLRADYHRIPLILGSATPSIQSMYLAEQKNYELLELTKRPFELQLPTIHYVDMKEELKQKNTSIFSRKLLSGIIDRLQKKEQVMLLYNRKGYAPFVMCRSCGEVPKCPHCDVSLTYYKDKNILKCHYCGYEKPFSKTCDNCTEDKVKEIGIGIEYIESTLKKALPQARVLRLDQNVTKTKHSHEKIWHEFASEQADILLGTQMIAKGLDFPKVTLMGILMADLSLKVPSYHASEKTYMLLSQASGRSGRFLPGETIIQGYNLSHFAIQSVDKPYEAFYKEALYERKIQDIEPFKKTSQILIQDLGFLKAYQTAFLLKKKLEALGIMVLGPSLALIKRIKDMYRFTITLKYVDMNQHDVFDIINLIKKQTSVDIRYYPMIDLV
ncbi:MAG: primosomal protein N' [Acholeplasmataceae bacterium]|jgi:primosomal protein N' (replication factor Y)|nr:primosomal protein N' [Acholeplasmataceae bacterium]